MGSEMCIRDRNLTCHQGIVSSVHSSGVATLIQVDASVNPSNSGGPMIDPSSGHVHGVISRKATGLSKMFDDLISSFQSNIDDLRDASANTSSKISGVDPIQALVTSQRQMEAISKELKRSANVGIGWAIKADALREEAAIAALK